MTVTTTTNKTTMTGINGQAAYSFNDFTLQQVSDLEVYMDDVLQVAGYTTVINADESITVTFSPALSGGEDLLFVRVVPVTQEVELPVEGAISEATLENAFDKLTMIVQQIQEQADRAITVPITDPDVDPSLPDPEPLYLIRWNAAGDALENVDVSSATSGAVIGPSSSTDHSLMLWDGATGALAKDGPGLGSAGHVLTSQGAGVDPAFAAPAMDGPASSTAYGVPLWSGTGGNVLLDGAGVGTNGQVLTSNGPGVAPSWETNGAGAGDVTGPVSSTTHALATYGDATGGLIADEIALGDAGDILVSGGAGAAPSFQTFVATVAQGGLGVGSLTAADGVMLVGDGGTAYKELTGTALQMPRIAAGGDWEMVSPDASDVVYRTATPGFSMPSANAGGLYSAAHGLGYTPKRAWLQLYCKTAEKGYAVGDIIIPEVSAAASAGNICFRADDTYIHCSLASLAGTAFFSAPGYGSPVTKNIGGVTIATDKITINGHGFLVGARIYIADIVGDLGDLLNGNWYQVLAVTTNDFTIRLYTGTTAVDFAGRTYTSGGTVTAYPTPAKQTLTNANWGILLCCQ